MMKEFLTLVMTFFLCYSLFAQRNVNPTGRIGIGLDATFFNLQSDDVDVKSNIGWAFGFEMRGEFKRNWDLIYGVQILDNRFSVKEIITGDEIKMSALSGELKALFAYRIANGDHFSIEAGPAISFNGEYRVLDKTYEDSIIAGDSAVTVDSFSKSSFLNLNGVIGFSAGFQRFKLTAHYHHAFLDPLNGKNALSEELNGSLSYITAGIRVYL